MALDASTLAIQGPLREYYPIRHLDTADESRWLTEIGWPIFNTSAELSSLS